MSLIESLQQTAAEGQTAALVAYREMLARNDNPKPKDTNELRRVMGVLGFDVGRLNRDLAALKTAATLETEAAADTPDLQKQAADAALATLAHLEETQRIILEREGEQHRLEIAADTLRRRLDNADNARRKLIGLREQHADLFGQPEPEPIPETRHGMVFGEPSPQEPADLSPSQRPVPFFQSPRELNRYAEQQSVVSAEAAGLSIAETEGLME